MLEKCLEEIRNSCQGAWEYIVIGGEIRKELTETLFGKALPGQDVNEHIDILVRCGQNGRREVLDYLSTNYLRRGLAYVGQIGSYNTEFVGIIEADTHYYIDNTLVRTRPDATIEKIGYSTKGLQYDEFGRGFGDFKDEQIVINPMADSEDLWLTKVIKLLQLKLQMGFEIEEKSQEKIHKYLADFDLSVLDNYDIPIYNQTPYNDVLFPFETDQLKLGLVIRALYSRCEDPKEATSVLTTFDSKLARILTRGGIDFGVFEDYARENKEKQTNQ